jgi:hypothetical protein
MEIDFLEILNFGGEDSRNERDTHIWGFNCFSRLGILEVIPQAK